ncbi:MAG: hypothetical protein WDW36_002300 [Sanguina aurantia]
MPSVGRGGDDSSSSSSSSGGTAHTSSHSGTADVSSVSSRGTFDSESLAAPSKSRALPHHPHSSPTQTEAPQSSVGFPSDAGERGTVVMSPEAGELLVAAQAVWAPLKRWQLSEVRTGVRALAPRTAAGSLPMLGKLACDSIAAPVWVIAGLGSRGLVYHGLLGRLLAEAVVSEREDLLPPELTSWKLRNGKPAVFEGG